MNFVILNTGSFTLTNYIVASLSSFCSVFFQGQRILFCQLNLNFADVNFVTWIKLILPQYIHKFLPRRNSIKFVYAKQRMFSRSSKTRSLVISEHRSFFIVYKLFFHSDYLWSYCCFDCKIMAICLKTAWISYNH